MKKSTILQILVVLLLSSCSFTDKLIPGLVDAEIQDADTIKIYNNSSVSSIVFISLKFYNDQNQEIAYVELTEGPAPGTSDFYNVIFPSASVEVRVNDYELHWSM